MRPQLIPGWPIHSYGLMLVIAFYAGYFLSRRTAAREGVNPDRMIDVLLIGAVLGILGARLFFVVQYGVSGFWQMFAVWQGGLVFYGGAGLATAGLLIYLWKKQLPVWRMADAAAPAIMLGLGLARIGCFLNGCCWGAITDEAHPRAVRFPRIIASSTFTPPRGRTLEAEGQWRVVVRHKPEQHGCCGAGPAGSPGHRHRDETVTPDRAVEIYREAPAPEALSFIWVKYERLPDGQARQHRIAGSPAFLQHLMLEPDRIGPDDQRSLPVHPSQLYATVAAFIICGLLLWWRRFRRRPGEVFAAMGVLYALARFGLEYFRSDTPSVLLGMNMGQLVGLPVLVVALAALIYCRVRPAKVDIGGERA